MVLWYAQFILMAVLYGMAADAIDYCPYGCRCPSIPVANCSYGGFREIPTGDFDLYVQDLDLSHNRFTSLEEHTLYQVLIPALDYLSLSHNDIEYINMKAFRAVMTIKQLDLSWNRIHFFNRRTIEYTPRLERLSLAGNPTIYISNTGGFLESKSLTHFNMSWSELGFIPDVMFEELPHLRHLDLSHNRLTRLRPEVFSKLSRLEWLDLRYNHLDSDQLDAISSYIGSKVTIITDPQRTSPCIWSSDSLANCSGKDITDLPEVGFTPTITDIDMSHNKLSRLTKEAVDRLGKVSQLLVVNFSHNVIEHIDEDAFKEGLNWLEVDLSWNRLKSICPNTFLHNYYIQKVSLAGNTQLVLNPSGNFLRAAPLLQLNMSHCGFSNIPDNIFSSVKKLHRLDLAHNNIFALQPEALSQLYQLKLLDVSYNNLTTLDTDTLSRLLNDNDIETEIENRMKRDVATILGLRNRMKRDADTSIGVRTDGNPWVCDCKMLEVQNWCQENQLMISVICQTPQELSTKSWEAIQSDKCKTASKITHHYSTTETPGIVATFFTQKQTMWLSIVGVALVLSVVMLVIVTVRFCTYIREAHITTHVPQNDRKKMYIPDSRDRPYIELANVHSTAYKPLLLDISDNRDRHSTPSSTISAASPSHHKGGDKDQRFPTDMEHAIFNGVQGIHEPTSIQMSTSSSHGLRKRVSDDQIRVEYPKSL